MFSVIFLIFSITPTIVFGGIFSDLRRFEALSIDQLRDLIYPLCHLNPTEYKVVLGLLQPVSSPHPITNRDVKFMVYTRENPKIPKTISGDEPASRIKSLGLDLSLEIIMFCNGYLISSISADIILPPVLLPQKDYIIINVNWDTYTFDNPAYATNVTVPLLGNIVGDFLTKLVCVGADPKKITLIGYSAGSQAVGLAAKRIRPKIARIFAFVPDGTCFNFMPDDQRVTIGDADYLVMVHCSSGIFEYTLDHFGNSTFYLNGGSLQPECVLVPTPLLQDYCSHLTCYSLLYSCLLNDNAFPGVKCGSYQDYRESNCNCDDKAALAIDMPNSVKGEYFIDTFPTKKPCSRKLQ